MDTTICHLLAPVSRIRIRIRGRGVRGVSGAGTNSRHVPYGSWADRDQLMLLDYDPVGRGVASRPFQLWWAQHDGRERPHTPPWLVRQACRWWWSGDHRRPDGPIKPADQAAFEAIAHACRLVSWQYRWSIPGIRPF